MRGYTAKRKDEGRYISNQSLKKNKRPGILSSRDINGSKTDSPNWRDFLFFGHDFLFYDKAINEMNTLDAWTEKSCSTTSDNLSLLIITYDSLRR